MKTRAMGARAFVVQAVAALLVKQFSSKLSKDVYSHNISAKFLNSKVQPDTSGLWSFN